MAGIRSRKGKHEVMWYDADGRQRSKTFPGETPQEELEQYHQARLEEVRQRKAGPDPLADALAALQTLGDGLRAVAEVHAQFVKTMDRLQNKTMDRLQKNVANQLKINRTRRRPTNQKK